MPGVTDIGLRSLEARDRRYVKWIDGIPGLGLRVGTSGKKCFVYTYRVGAKVKWETLGAFAQLQPQVDGELSLADAREAASRRNCERRVLMRTARKEGVPYEELQNHVWAEEIRKAKARARARRDSEKAETVKGLATRYIENHAKPRPEDQHKGLRSWDQARRILEGYLIPELGDLRIRDVTREQVNSLIKGIGGAGKTRMANKVRTTVTSMFRYAVEDIEILELSPCVSIKRYEEKSGERFLDEQEIHAFWHCLDDFETRPGVRIALKILLATGQRRGEVAGAKWSEFSGDGWWTIPGERAKNGRTHRVWLADIASGLFGELKDLAGDSVWVLPGGRGNAGHLTADLIAKAIITNGNVLQAAGITEKFTPHDLRRTAITHMKGIRAIRNDVARVVNHSDSTVTSKVYDLYTYDPEKQAALEAWDRKLKLILTGETTSVVEFRRA